MSDDFSAVSSMLGYLYQVKYSLLQALKEDDYKYISIEKFDDVALMDENNFSKLCQLKHHKSGSLSDSSGDLWKTIRIWCSVINEGKINIDKTKFMIITTQVANEGSISFNFTHRGKRKKNCLSTEEIIEKLKAVTKNSTNKENISSYKEFNKTSTDNLKMLVDNIIVIDNSPKIQDVEVDIKKQIRYVCPIKHINAFYERLEGWWLKRVINHLTISNLPSIEIDELRYKIDDLREQFFINNLPIDFTEDIELDISIYSDNVFVNQLKLIDVRKSRFVSAINDFYKASAQRSRWSRDNLISLAEIDKYEKKLINEWERIFDATLDEYENEITKVACGKKIYKNIELATKINIRDKCTELYVMRGSYHILSNDLRVGWHPDFSQLINVEKIESEGA